MTRLPEGKTRLDLVRQGLADGGLKKRGRLIVSLSKLIEDPHNERKTFRNMDGMIASMKAVGLIEPITVTPAGEETYQIITGHRRYRAAKAAGLEQVEILIREPEEELKRRQKSIISNVQREDIGPVEMAEALQSLMDEGTRIKTQDDLAKMIGKDKAWVSGMLRILGLPSGLQQKVGCTQQTISYDSMIRIARIDNERHQGELITVLLGGASQKEIRDHIDRIKQANGEGMKVSPPKPKRVYHTTQKATVIVQATSSRLNHDQCLAALREALMQAAESASSAAEN